MEGDTAVPSKANRRGSGSAVYTKCLNIKSNVLPDDNKAVTKAVEISNSTDEYEKDAGIVVSNDKNGAAREIVSSGFDVFATAAPADGKQEPEEENHGQSEPQQPAIAETMQPKAPHACTLAVEDNTQLTAVGTSCASVHSTVDTCTVTLPPSTTTLECGPGLSSRHLSPLPPTEQYATSRAGVSMQTTNDGRDTTSPRMKEYGGSRSPKRRQSAEPVSLIKAIKGFEGPVRRHSQSRSRSRGRNGNGMVRDINGEGRPWPPYQGPCESNTQGRFGGRPGSSSGRPGSPPYADFDERFGSPPRGGYHRRSDSPSRNGSGGGRSPPRDGFDRARESFGRDGFIGHPGSLRGRSPPREDFRRGQSMRPGRDGRVRDFRDGYGPGRNSPYGECGPGRPRRSRSRSPFSRRSMCGPPKNGNGFGPPDRRSRSRSPGKMGMGRSRSPPRNGYDGRGPGGPPPPFDDRGPSSMGRPMSPPRGENFRFRTRGSPMNGRRPSLERDGRPNMFCPRGRSRSLNRPAPSEMVRKRDCSWERGGPPPDMVQQPLNAPPLDSPRAMEPRPYDTPSEWNFELKRSGKPKCRCSATSLSVGISCQLPLYLDVVTLPHLRRSPEFLQLDRPNVRRVVYELKPESMADASSYREFIDYLIQGRGGHARAGAATEMEPQGFKIFLLPPGQAARQIGYKGDHMIAVLRSR